MTALLSGPPHHTPLSIILGVFGRVNGGGWYAVLNLFEWTSRPCPFPYIALILGFVTCSPASSGFANFWIWRVMTSQILGSWFVWEVPEISDLSSLTWASRPSTAPAAARERRTSSGRNEVGTTTLHFCQFICNLYRRSPPCRRTSAFYLIMV